jgi:hypothetical protein
MAPQQRTFTVTLGWSTPLEYSSGNAPSIPTKPGVYEIIVKLQNNSGKRQYVGESDDLHTRFFQHLQDSEPNACVKDKVTNKTTFFRYAQPIESKFLICKDVACEHDPALMTQLWREHDRLRLEFLNRLREFREGEILSEKSHKPQFSFLDLKVELLDRILRSSSIDLLKWPTIGILNSSVPEFGAADVFFLVAAVVVVTVVIVSSVIVRCWHL